MYPLKEVGTCRKNDTGSTVQFYPDGEIFEKTYFKADAIKSRLHETAYLNPNLTIIFENKRVAEEEVITCHEPDGICAYVAELNKEKENKNQYKKIIRAFRNTSCGNYCKKEKNTRKFERYDI